ncbi:dienelactone hydrolase family protein, partial [Actinomadura luteofluorescens]
PRIAAVVSRGGRPDLAGPSLARVRAPVLLIVGALDTEVLELNERAHRSLAASEVHVIPGAGHLFEEPGALEEVTAQAADWFDRHL